MRDKAQSPVACNAILATNPPELVELGNGRNLLLTTEDVASELRIAQVTVKLSRKSGYLLGVPAPPYIKVGRLVRYRREDILRWLGSLDRVEPECAGKLSEPVGIDAEV